MQREHLRPAHSLIKSRMANAATQEGYHASNGQRRPLQL